MSTPLYIDKTHCWFGHEPDQPAHCYHHTHRLCDSAESTPTTKSVPATFAGKTCPTCLALLNTAIHDQRGALYGGR